jgi:hypothetical protein
MTTEEFFGLVRDMRNKQRLYFGTRSRETLMEAKKAEDNVDQALSYYFSPLLNPGHKEEFNMPKLF